MVFSIPIFLVLIITIFLFQKLPEVLLSTNESEVKLLKSFQFSEEKENLYIQLEKMETGLSANYNLIYNNSKNNLKTEVDNAYSIIESIYKLNKPKKEKIKIIKSTLRNLRYFHGNGYFFICDGNYYNVLQPIESSYEGKNIKNWKDAKGNRSMYDLISKAKEKGFTWHTWYYKVPNSNLLDKKIGYARYFKELDIIIAMGIYEVDLKNRFFNLMKNRFKSDSDIYIMQNGNLIVGNKELSELKNSLIQESKNFYISKNRNSILVYDFIEDINLEVGVFKSLSGLEKDIFIQQSEINRIFEKLKLDIISVIFIIIAFATFLSLLLSMILTKHIKNYIERINHLNKRLQEKVDVTTKERQESDELFRAVFHFVPSFMVLFDSKLKYLNINQSYKDLFGVTKEEVLGKEMGIARIIKDVKAFKELKNRVLTNGEVLDYEYEVYTKDKKEAVFSISIKKIEIHSKNYYILIGRDISSYKNLLNKYEQLNIELENRIQNELMKNRQQQDMLLMQSRFATMGEMISMIAHQWRQPLNVLSLIMVNINLKLEFGSLENDFLFEQIEKADKTIKHMSATIDDFKNLLSKDTKSKVVELKDIVDKAISIVGPQLVAHNIFIDLECEKTIQVYLNDSELTQVLLNIISNSKDAIIEHNLEHSTIRISSKEEKIDNERYIILSLEDRAGGIDEEIIHKVFEPYFSTKGKNGTGIGLYMSKLIVEKYKGIISVENSKNGVKFDIKLPIYIDGDFAGGG
jgi:PAS domain S-box-containing protein